MELQRLLRGVEIKSIIGETKKDIEGIAYNSKNVEKDFLFTAIRGLEVDGHKFIYEAIKNGAEAIVLEELKELYGKTGILVSDSRKALSKISSNFYGDPSAKLKLIGVTGTNGKTTTTYLLESIFKKAGFETGVIGTINYRYGEKIRHSPNTTPESLDLQRILFEMLSEGISHVIMEVSSHGLDLDRVSDCHFDCAIFTNITQDHLDYHKTFQRYFESKRRLFYELLVKSNKNQKFAIINQDDPKGSEIVKGINLPVISYGINSNCDITAQNIVSSFKGLTFEVKTKKNHFTIKSRLAGIFNVYNILAAIATAIEMGLSEHVIKQGILSVEEVPGRFERVENQKGIRVIVDYAHTPDALERVLLSLREILTDEASQAGKIITVFGCGGDRDRTKRPLMGEISGRLSDLTILTSDNPRTEDPLVIIEEIEIGLKNLSLKKWSKDDLLLWRQERGYIKIPDRREAIATAVKLAQPFIDTILIAGKGHEDYQIIGKKKFPFDDRKEVIKAIEEKWI